MLLSDKLLMGKSAIIPITFVNSNFTQNTASGTTLVINKPVNTIDGDLMIASMGTSSTNATTWTGGTGWNEVYDQNARGGLRLAWKIAASEGASYTFTNSVSSDTLGGVILTYRHALFDIVGLATTATNPVAPSINVALANSILIGYCNVSNANATFTLPATMTQKSIDNGSNGPSWIIGDETINNGASGTRSFIGTPTNSTAILLAIKPN
jgi:hypothetical protein